MEPIESSSSVIVKAVNGCGLIRVESKTVYGGKVYKGLRYEVWSDLEKMQKGIVAEDGKIYCRGLAGCSEEEALQILHNMAGSALS